MDDRSSDDKLLRAIKHYQDSVTRHTESGNDAKILHAIKKLYDLPITVAHLQETGVGRTINALRKNEGSVGQASRSIVQKWKSMVEQEDTVQEQEQRKENVYEKESDDDDEDEEEEEEVQEEIVPVHKSTARKIQDDFLNCARTRNK